jgi:hypothetical protein
MSTTPTPADLADYDQVHANTTAYLDALVKTLRALVEQGIPRHLAVTALAVRLLDPPSDSPPNGRFTHADVTQFLAIAVDHLERGWPT